jgi:hypothetical protein
VAPTERNNDVPLEAPCRAIVEATEGLLAWEFDGRFRAALATFPAADQAGVLAALEAGFEARWTHADIAGAPPRVVELTGKLGGVRPGQIVLTSGAESDPILVGLWWPWGNGTRISIRVLFSARSLSDARKAALLADFKGWFGLSG